MYWTLELASKLEDAPWPATKDELIDYAVRSGLPLESAREFAGDRRRGRYLRIDRGYLAGLSFEG